MVTPVFTPTERTTVRRLPKRAAYDRQTVYSILDEGLVCHISFVCDAKWNHPAKPEMELGHSQALPGSVGGAGFQPGNPAKPEQARPVTIPTGYGRDGDILYIHGSPASRMLRTLAGGVEACVTVTLLDGLVLARSAFHHSMNYRSVVIFGKAMLVEEPERKLEALRIFTEHVIPGRWSRVRTPTPHELKSTTVLAMPLDEVSAKIRTGPPIDDEEDMGIETWAGVIPLRLTPGTPLPDSDIPFGAAPDWRRPLREPSVL